MSRVRTFVEPFALSYPFAPEMVDLKPAMADVHGGVSIAKANETEGFLFLMLAYLGQTKNDKLTLFVNEETGPSTTIAEGKENDDTPLRLPAGLLQKGLNRIKIQAERTSGNNEFTKELVLYHRTSPPGDTPPVMNLTTSHKVIGAGEADTFKVTVTYDNLQWYDRIVVFCNGAHFEYPLTPSSVAPLPPLPTNVVIDIPKDKLIEGGNDKTFEIKYRVIDYVTNPSGPPTWSDAVFVEVDLDKISLAPPKLINATSPIDVLASEAGVRVQAEFTAAVANDKATLKIVDGVPGAPFPTVPFNVNQRANFTLSVAFLLAHQGKTIQVSWLLIRDGVQAGESPPLELVINTIAVDDPRLPTPNIAGEIGQQLDVQDLPADARVLSEKIPLMQQNHPVWVDFEGVDAEGNPVNKQVLSGGPSELVDRISVLADVEWLKTLKDASPLKVLCAANLDGVRDKSKAVLLPVRTYTVSAAPEVVLTFTNAPYTIAPAGRLKNIELLLSTSSDAPVPQGKLSLTIPAGFTYADGGSGKREFVADDDGRVSVSGVKGGSGTGSYSLSAASGSQSASANVTVTGLGPLSTIRVVGNPYFNAVNPDGTRLYVSTRSGHTICVIDTVTNEVLTNIPVGEHPYGITFNPDGTRAYVCNHTGDTVSVIDTATNRVLTNIPVESPYHITVSPDGSRAYVCDHRNSTVSVIDTATNRVLTSIPVRNSATGIAVSPDGTRIYVSCVFSHTLEVIDTATNRVLTSISVGTSPTVVAISSDGTRVYVLNSYNRTVSVIDTATDGVLASIPVGEAPGDVAVIPDGTRIFVSCHERVYAIDTVSNRVLTTIPVPNTPVGIALSSDGTRAYVCSFYGNTVTAIATTGV